ncbi:MAG: hypothetical protein KDC34_00220 [Saprospiraceae bacterium]|nr:hypothetical protein [Saprospiraceae bacterium]
MRIHLIAIGGSAMHNLALALQANGHDVSGSDDEIYDPAHSRLKENGLLPDSVGWSAARIDPEIDIVIVGMHARPDNPELLKAIELGLEIHSYPSYLYQHARKKERIVVGGSHGKTTTTAIIMHVLQKSNTSFDYLVGAQLAGFDHMVHLSDAPLMVLEGDEYLSSPLDTRSKFLHYKPQLAILTGIAWDHINVFPTFESYLDTFRQFIQGMESNGFLFYYGEDPALQEMVKHAPEGLTCIPYRGFDSGKSPGTVNLEGMEVSWPLFGAHNRQNLQAAWLVCKQLGIPKVQFAAAIQDFAGPSLRMQQLVSTEKLTVFRDFAHAPSKLRASIQAIRTEFPNKKLKAVFELHTFSSLNKSFLPDYQNTMDPADKAVVFYLPHTLEMKRMPALAPDFIRKAFQREDLIVLTSTEDLKNWLDKEREEGGVFAMMSSGNFGKLPKWYEL